MNQLYMVHDTSVLALDFNNPDT